MNQVKLSLSDMHKFKQITSRMEFKSKRELIRGKITLDLRNVLNYIIFLGEHCSTLIVLESTPPRSLSHKAPDTSGEIVQKIQDVEKNI